MDPPNTTPRSWTSSALRPSRKMAETGHSSSLELKMIVPPFVNNHPNHHLNKEAVLLRGEVDDFSGMCVLERLDCGAYKLVLGSFEDESDEDE